MKSRFRKSAGFTLTELAIVLIIVALMVGGLLISVSTTRDIADTGEVQKQLVSLQEALLGYAAVHGRLPCPDTDLDGSENQGAPITVNNAPAAGQSQVTNPCVSEEGLLPHREIGLPPGDVWNNRFRYRVTAAFARKVDTFDALNGGGTRIRTGGIDLGTVGNITINTRGDNPATGAVETKNVNSLTVQAPAVIISHGRNSYGATPVNGPARPAPPAANADETTNATDGQTKWTRTLTGVSNACSDSAGTSALCEFDDVIHWISPNLIFNRLITAGRLP